MSKCLMDINNSALFFTLSFYRAEAAAIKFPLITAFMASNIVKGDIPGVEFSEKYKSSSLSNFSFDNVLNKRDLFKDQEKVCCFSFWERDNSHSNQP